MSQSPRPGAGDLSFVFERTTDLVGIIDAGGCWERVSASFEHDLGWTPDALVGQEWLSLIDEDDVASVRVDVERLPPGMPPRVIEARARRRTGGSRRVRWTVDREAETGRVRVLGRPVSDDGVVVARPTQVEAAPSDIDDPEFFEALFRELAAQLPEFVWVRDVETGRILYANEGWERATGRPATVGSHFTEFFSATHPDDVERAVRASDKTRLGGYDEVLRNLHTDGSIRWMHVRTFPIRNTQGKVYRVAGVGENITDHVVAARAFAAERDRLRQILDSQSGLVAVLSAEGNIVEINHTTLDLARLRREQALGRRFWEVAGLAPAAETAMRDAIGRAADGEVVRSDMVARFPGGGRYDLDLAFSPLRDAAGRVVNVVAVGVDVTERRRAEEALRDREERLRQIVRLSHIGIFDHDHATGDVYWSPEQRDIYGWAAHEEVRFQTDAPAGVRTTTDLIHPEDRDRVLAEISLAHERGSFETDYRIIRPDGAVRWVSTRAQTFFDGEGDLRRPLRTIGATLDITERVAASEALRESLREKETLLREVHHRVKNNLQIIASLLHFQAKKVKDPADLMAFTEGRDRLRAMILVHEKLYQSQGLSRIDFGGYLRALVGDLQRSYAVAGRGVVVRVTADDLALPIEPALACGMIVCELVTNVFKYAFPGERTGQAEVRLSVADTCVSLTVVDDGVGMAPGFDPAAASTFGWQLIRNLTTQLDGAVIVRSGDGTHVDVTFRLEDEDA